MDVDMDVDMDVRRRRWVAGCALLGLALLAGCGSTVDLSGGGAQVGSSLQDGLGLTAPSVAAGPSSSSALDGGVGATEPAPSSAAGGASSIDAVAGSSSSTASATAVKRDTSPLEIGVATFSGAKAIADLGVSDIPKVDGKTEYQDLANYFNAHGGFGGRQIKLITYAYPLLPTESPTVESQAACAMFTQDNHVSFVVADRASNTEVLTTCLAKADVPLFQDSPNFQDARELTEGPVYYPSSGSGQRMVRNWFDGLDLLGYFSGKYKLAYMYCSYVTYDDIVKSVPADASALGLKISEMTGIDCDDTNSTKTETENAALKYRTEGITDVMLMDSGAALAGDMTSAANNDGYHPRYGLTTVSVLSLVASNAPKGQLDNALAIGWWPYEDVDTPYQPKFNSAAQLCSTIYAADGYDVTDRNTRAAIMWPCSLMFFARQVMASTHGVTTPAAIKQAVESLGTSYVSSEALATDFSPTQHDGLAAYRAIKFSTTCSCFLYANSTVYPTH